MDEVIFMMIVKLGDDNINSYLLFLLGLFKVKKAKSLIADDSIGKKKPVFSFQAANSGYLDID